MAVRSGVKQSPRRRHIPLRTCVACRTKTSKRQLLRIVAQPDNSIEVDPSGKLNGRGTYLCPDCAANAHTIHKGRIEHSLRTTIDTNRWQSLLTHIAQHKLPS